MHHPTIKDLNLDLTQWQPIIEERGMVNWLVKTPSDQELSAARLMPLAVLNRLEEVGVMMTFNRLEEVGVMMALLDIYLSIIKHFISIMNIDMPVLPHSCGSSSLKRP